NRQVVVAGTGFEGKYNTALLASRDWKYLALFAQRKAKDNPEIDLIDTTTDTLSNIDEGNAGFSLVGWDGHQFVYQVNRNNVELWQNGRQVIKAFNAETKKLATLVSSGTHSGGDGLSYAYQQFGGVYIIGNKVVYALNWSSNNCYYYYGVDVLAGQQASLN